MTKTISKHLCENCKHFTITLCCDSPICREMEWEPSEFGDSGMSVDEFLTEKESEWNNDYCYSYEYNETLTT